MKFKLKVINENHETVFKSKSKLTPNDIVLQFRRMRKFGDYIVKYYEDDCEVRSENISVKAKKIIRVFSEDKVVFETLQDLTYRTLIFKLQRHNLKGRFMVQYISNGIVTEAKNIFVGSDD